MNSSSGKTRGGKFLKQFIFVVLFLGIGFIVFFGSIAYSIFPWAAMFAGISLMPNPPRPSITHGEFPFHLVYEINGKQVTVDDTVVCDYDGIGMNEGIGKYRKWKEHLANGNNNAASTTVGGSVVYYGVLLLKINDTTVYYDVGTPDYYMGDIHSDVDYSPGVVREDGSFYSGGSVDDKELWDKYKIKIINWTHAPPIKNTFK